MKKFVFLFIVSSLFHSAFAQSLRVDVTLGNSLTALMNDEALGEYVIEVSARLDQEIVPGQISSTPILLVSPIGIQTPDDFSTCEANLESLTCIVSQNVDRWVHENQPENGKVMIDATIWNSENVVIKSLKNIEIPLKRAVSGTSL